MGRLIKNHWARLIILSAAGWQVGASIEGFIWPKVFWDFLTHNLDGSVKQIPVLQIINLVLGIVALAWEWPLKPLAGTFPHQSIPLRLLVYPLSALTCALMYQSGDVAVYYLIGMGAYFWAYSEGEIVCAVPWTLPRKSKRLQRGMTPPLLRCSAKPRTLTTPQQWPYQFSHLTLLAIPNNLHVLAINSMAAPQSHEAAMDKDDHDVDRTRSFNGRLGQFVHQIPDPTTTPTPTPTPTTPTTPTRRHIITRSKSSSLSPSTTPPISSPQRPRAKRKRRLHEAADTTAAATLPSRLRDSIPANLILLLIGVNPGLMTASTGYAYAHPSNLFWKLLHSSGITTRRHAPSDTYKLPALYSVGNTNIVERASRDASMLTKAEMDAGVPILEAKIARQRPEAVALVGKSIWESIWRVRHGRAIKKDEFRYGWQDESENMGGSDKSWTGARVFVATTTSGLAASMSLQEKQEVWKVLGQWVQQRREERGFVPGVSVEVEP